MTHRENPSEIRANPFLFMGCIFCKIISKELPADFVYEDEEVVAFKDIHPKAPCHILIVSRKHIDSVDRIRPEDGKLIAATLFAAQRIARDLTLAASGYKLVFNVGRGGGQLVDHLHLHLLGGWGKEGLEEMP